MNLTFPSQPPPSPLDRIIAAIEQGSLKPGMRLLETELAAQLQVSRTPVREALHRLSAMGLATPGPQRGLIVAQMSYEQLRQLFEARKGLEGMAARLAATYGSKEEVALLHEMIEYDRGVSDLNQLSERNKLLHRQIARASHNTYVIDAINNLRIHLILLTETAYSLPERVANSMAEHEKIIDAITRGDGDAAELAAREHVESGYRTRLSMINDAN
ncbi:MAG TPA: GntR family transcriptional regulator [Devosia sp.]|nr:GntR family transcriptional regulator [Devosia sp.]